MPVAEDIVKWVMAARNVAAKADALLELDAMDGMAGSPQWLDAIAGLEAALHLFSDAENDEVDGG